MKWQDRISVNPQVCHGKPCIRDWGDGIGSSRERGSRRTVRGHHEWV